MLGSDASTVFKMYGSDSEEIVNGIRLQYSLYQLENIPEEYYLRKEAEVRGKVTLKC